MNTDLNDKLATLDWRLLQSFLAAAQAGSLSRAAAMLGDSQPTLSRRLAQLEQALGQALFERSPRGLAPTPAGRALFKRALPLWGAAEQEVRTAMGAKLTADLHGALDRSMEKLAPL